MSPPEEPTVKPCPTCGAPAAVFSGDGVLPRLLDDGPGDVKFWVELGASLMLGKPIVLLTRNDDDVPDRLRQIAADLDSQEGIDRVGREMAEVVKNIEEVERGRRK